MKITKAITTSALLSMLLSYPEVSKSKDTTWTDVEKLPAEVESELTKDFKDPFSVKYRNLKVSNRGLYCGEINGKNSYGAYSGFKKFYASEEVADVATDETALAIIDIFCGDGVKN